MTPMDALSIGDFTKLNGVTVINFKKEQGKKQLEALKRHLEAADRDLDIACITQCFDDELAQEVDWLMWNMYLKIYVPAQHKQPAEIVEQIKMMVYMSLMSVVSLHSKLKVPFKSVNAYRQLDKHESLRDIAMGIQDIIASLEQLNIYPMHRSKTAERNRVRFHKEKNELKRKGML